MIVTYPIHELFMTFQGEGTAMGMPAFFVRTYGCPVHCTFCDSAGTWHKDYVPSHVARMSPKALVQAALLEQAKLMVVTGGEPTIFDLTPLTDECEAAGIDIHLETSGAFAIRGEFDWVVLSPKRAQLPLPESLARADEFKFIIEHPDDIGYFTRVLFDRGVTLQERRWIWLHPEWSQRENKAVLSAIAEQVKRGKGNYRAGWQLHKLYQVDALDNRSKPLVPLGGDPAKGF